MLLRRFKHRMALLTGLAELGGVWPTEATLEAMSVTADAVLEQATAFLFRKAREAGQLAPPDDAVSTAPGYFVIGMGKLGASELNYSSDIDLIVLYDGERSSYRAGDRASRTASCAWPAIWCACSRSTPKTAMSFAPISGCGPIQARRPLPCRWWRRRPITRAWARTGSARP